MYEYQDVHHGSSLSLVELRTEERFTNVVNKLVRPITTRFVSVIATGRHYANARRATSMYPAIRPQAQVTLKLEVEGSPE